MAIVASLAIILDVVILWLIVHFYNFYYGSCRSANGLAALHCGVECKQSTAHSTTKEACNSGLTSSGSRSSADSSRCARTCSVLSLDLQSIVCTDAIRYGFRHCMSTELWCLTSAALSGRWQSQMLSSATKPSRVTMNNVSTSRRGSRSVSASVLHH